MWLSPSMILMCLSILTSIFLVLSSPSFLVSWVGLELNTMVFLPMMLMEKTKMSSEASIKYFLTQTLASILIICGAIFFLLQLSHLGTVFILFGLFIKLGAAPFHSWILSIAECVGWGVLFILLTVQKINPLIMMWVYLGDTWGLVECVIILSLLVGGAMGLAQTSSRLLISFSSINHVGWMLAALSLNMWLGVCYFSIYLFILMPVILILSTFNISHINEFFLVDFPILKQLVLFLSFLSLGGLPPFLGFLPKWLVLQSVLGGGFLLISLAMVLTSLFTLFFYLRMTFSAFIMGGVKLSSKNSFKPLSNLSLIFFTVSLAGLPLFLFV